MKYVTATGRASEAGAILKLVFLRSDAIGSKRIPTQGNLTMAFGSENSVLAA